LVVCSYHGVCEADDVILTTIHRQHRHGREAPPRTLGALLHQLYWLWLRCDACGHSVAVALVPFVIR
jgi:hypothetical protein